MHYQQLMSTNAAQHHHTIVCQYCCNVLLTKENHKLASLTNTIGSFHISACIFGLINVVISYFCQIIDIAEVRYIRELPLLRNLNLLGNAIQVGTRALDQFTASFCFKYLYRMMQPIYQNYSLKTNDNRIISYCRR